MISIYFKIKQRFHFSYINENEITYMCMSEQMQDDVTYAFLSDVRRKFIQNYDFDKIAGFNAYQLTEFSEILKQFIVIKKLLY